MKAIYGVLAALTLAGCSGQPSPSLKRTETVIRGVNYVGIAVSDLDRAADFYTGATDLTLVEESRLENSPALDKIAGRDGVIAETRLYRSANAQLRFMKFANPSEDASTTLNVEVQGPGFSHVCYQVAKATKAYDRFLELGATPVGARDMVQLNPRNPVEYAYARDLDGTLFEVEHVDVEKLDLNTPPKNNYRMRHVAIATPDIDRITEFYSVLLEEPNPRRIGRLGGISGENLDKVSGLPGSKIKMSWFQIRNMEFEIGHYVSHPTDTPSVPRPLDALGYNMIVFDVAGLDAAREKLIAAGGEVISDVEAMDGGEIFFGRDPDGNLLGFQFAPAGAAISAQNFEDNGI